jgi:hypothetical protein
MEIEYFLNQISEINKRYNEIAKATGENFNIFDVLNIGSQEGIHSKFIAMLLDPKGVHGMGNIFPKYFFNIIGQKNNRKDISGFPVEDIAVQTEFFIGPIDEKNEHGGRVDIAISDNKNRIFIENKIYAQDQNNQLMRYKNNYPDAKIIYLTLDGREPSDESAKNMRKDEYICVSYKDHILEWLETCKKEAVDYPLLRETLQQYITLVKSLTGQERSRQMSDEILNYITKDEESFSAYLSVSNIAKETAFKYVLKNKVIPLLDKIAENRGLEFEVSPDADILKEDYGFKFFKEDWEKISIFFAFDKNLQDLSVGVFNEKDWLIKTRSIDKYKNWHWSNTEVLKKLCCPNNDIILEIDNKIAEFLPEVEAELKKAENKQ